MDEAKFKEISALLDVVSPSAAVDLVRQFEAMRLKGELDIEIDRLIEPIRAKLQGFEGEIKRMPGIDRLFFEPISPLLESGDDKNLIPGSFPRQYLARIWKIIESDLGKECLSLLEPKINESVLSNNYLLSHQLANILRKTVLTNLKQYGKYGLSQFDKSIPEAISERFYNLLILEERATEAKISIFTDIDLVHPNSQGQFLSLLKKLEKEDQNLAAEYMLIMMATSKKPWHVFRFFKEITSMPNDIKLSVSVFETIGTRLFKILERIISDFEISFKSEKFDGKKLSGQVEIYNQINQGIERESILSPAGPWRKILNKIRSNASIIFNEICEKALEETLRAFPTSKQMVKGSGMLELCLTNTEIPEAKIQKSFEFVKFIKHVRLFAPLAGIGATRDKIEKKLIAHLETCQQGLIIEMKNEDLGRHFNLWVDRVAELTKFIDDETASRAFKKRISA